MTSRSKALVTCIVTARRVSASATAPASRAMSGFTVVEHPIAPDMDICTSETVRLSVCNAVLGAGGGIRIGSHVQIGQCVNMQAENHDFRDADRRIDEQGVTYEGIVVEDDVWIGSKATILDGVTIGQGAVVACRRSCYGGCPTICGRGRVPARIIKMRGAATSESRHLSQPLRRVSASHEMTRHLAERHQIDVYTLATADHDFCDPRPFSTRHVVMPFQALPLARRPFGRLNQGIRIADLLRLKDYSARWQHRLTAVAMMSSVHNCRFSQSPGLMKFLRTPSAYYCGEPPRFSMSRLLRDRTGFPRPASGKPR